MEGAISKELFVNIRIILIAKFFVASIFASASEPFADNPANRSTPEHSTSESTQEWLERRLRAAGKLEEGQRLKPHQIWRIADRLKKKVENRALLKVIEDNRELLLREGITEQTITKVLNGQYHSKTKSFGSIVEVLIRKKVVVKLNGRYVSAESLEATKTTRGAQAAEDSDDAPHSAPAATSVAPY